MFKNTLKKIKPVKFKQPHFIWPEKDEKINKAVFNYLSDYKNGKNGLPDIIQNLETSFKNFNSNKYCLSLSSCTAALHIAYLALGLEKNDEVIVSDYTFPATVIPLFLIGAKPILCDTDKEFANIDPDKIEKLITKKTKAITVTHWWGQPCDMYKICKIAKKHKLALVEDCAHAPGARYRNKKVGTFGDFGCFSLDNNKLIASGEGGLLVTNKRDLYEKAILFSDFGPRLYKDLKLSSSKIFKQTGLGTKYRIHFLAAKIAFEKLKMINKMNSQRREVFNYFSKKLMTSKLLIPPRNKRNFTRGGYYGYKVILRPNKFIKIKKFIKVLNDKNIDARKTLTPPLHMTNTFKSKKINNFSRSPKLNFLKSELKNSKWFHDNHISFPTFYKKTHKKIIDEYVRVIISTERALGL